MSNSIVTLNTRNKIYAKEPQSANDSQGQFDLCSPDDFNDSIITFLSHEI